MSRGMLPLAAAMLCCLLNWSVHAADREVVLDLSTWRGAKPSRDVEKDGLPVASWDDMEKVRSLEAKEFPKDWTPFRSIRLWIYCPAKRDSVIHLIVSSDNPKTKGGDYYSWSFRPCWVGWRQAAISLDQMGRARQPLGWDHVTRLLLHAHWGRAPEAGTQVCLAGFTLSPDPAPGSPPLAANECFRNGSFEQDGNFDERPDHWGGGSYGTEAQVALDRTTALHGSASVRIFSPARSARGGWSYNITREAHVKPGAPYLFRGYCKTQDAVARSPGVCARFTYVDAKGKVIKTEYATAEAGTHDWQKVERLFLLPAATVRFNVVLFLNGSGTVWWDRVSLMALEGGPITAIHPVVDACVDDPRPTFEWSALGGASTYTVEVSDSPHFGVAGTKVFSNVSGTRLVCPEPLPAGKLYTWRVRGRDTDGRLRLSYLTGPDAGVLRFPQFFAGSWAQRARAAQAKAEGYRAVQEPLRAFAQRNQMWDAFGILREGIARMEGIVQSRTAESARDLSQLDETTADLDLHVAWWRKTFLGDEEFLASLDLARPGLESVQAAHAVGNLGRAKAELLQYFRTRTKPEYFFDPASRPPGLAKPRGDRRADLLCTHKYPIHSYKTPTYDLGRDLNWHVHPIIDREWPTYLHRHGQWRTLYSAYWRTHNEKYAAELKQQILDWVKDNPIERWDPKRRRFAWSTLNAASRMIHSWLHLYLRLRESPHFDVDTATVFLKMIQEHARYLMTHQARGGNWLIAESNALAVLGTLWPEFKEAPAWRAKGYGRLTEQLFAQVFDDGIHIERTPGYHGGCISLFLKGLQLAAMNDVDFEGRDRYVERIEKMFDFYLYGAKPDGFMPVLGDVGRMRAHSQLERGARMFHRRDMLYVATDGKQGVEPVETSHAFPQSGLYAMRSAWGDPNALHMFLDCGGYFGHCHHDIFTFEIYAYGRTLLAEAGRYAYAAEINKYFRGTVGHNTVLVDGQNQAREPAPECLVWTSCPAFDYLHGRHTNYPGIVHERRMLFLKPSGPEGDGYWVLTDDLTGAGEHRCDQRFHYPPDVKAEARGLQAQSTKPGHATLIIAAPTSPGLTMKLDPGWVSYKWYGKQPAVVPQFTKQGPLPQRFETVLYPVRADAAARVDVKRLAPERRADVAALAVTVTPAAAGPFHDVVVLRSRSGDAVQVAGLATDARVAYVRTDASGRVVRAIMEQGRALSWRGRELLAASKPVAFASVARHRGGAAVWSSEVEELAVRAGPGPLVVNGRQAPANAGEEVVRLRDVKAPARRPIPRDPLPPAIGYQRPTRSDASGVMPMLDREAVAGLRSAIRIEAEDLSGEGGGRVLKSSRKIGASKQTVYHWDAQGHWLEWRFDVPADGKYFLVIKAATAKDRALRKVEIDGRVPAPMLEAAEVAYTGGYCNQRDDWVHFLLGTAVDKPCLVTLKAGQHVLRMTNASGDSLNLDYILIVSH